MVPLIDSARYQLANLKLSLNEDPREPHALIPLVARRLGVRPQAISDLKVLRRAVDARQKPRVSIVYTLEFSLTSSPSQAAQLGGSVPGLALVSCSPEPTLLPGTLAMRGRPMIVGAGPAGLFCALRLARHGYAPLVVERGDEVTLRKAAVEHFWATGELDPNSNVQYGEGGAGTFSDGKLTTRIRDRRVSQVLEAMVAAGAPPDILFEAKPHVGTDRLVDVVANLRREIIRLGGEVRFRTALTDFHVENGHVRAVTLVGPHGELEVPVGALVLALGNSARDTFEMLRSRGLQLEAKAFSVGARIEHEQSFIDESQYGAAAGHPKLGAADYQLSLRDQATGMAAYTFCMCPGGEVVAASSEPGGVVTNGMSQSQRDSGVANAALVVSIDPETLPGYDALRGVEFQRRLERRAFEAGGGGYKAPSQTVGSFLGEAARGPVGRPSSRAVQPTYRPGVVEADLHTILPHDVCSHMERALGAFDKTLRGFSSPGARLTAVETRTSCPIRMTRDDTCQAIGVAGLYPAGEGAGYAGGITSASVDGLRVAEAMIARYCIPRDSR